MQCYRHREAAAVGVCSICGRGLCPDCASEREYALACKGVHEEAVDRMTAHTVRSVENYDQVMSAANRQTRAQGIVVTGLGLIIAGFGWTVRGHYNTAFTVFLLATGGLLALFGVTRLFGASRYPEADEPRPSGDPKGG